MNYSNINSETLETILHSFSSMINESNLDDYEPFLYIDKTNIQKYFKDYISERKFDTVSLLIELSNKMPEEKLIQNFYNQYMQDADLDSIEKLRKITKIVPTVLFSSIQNGYSKCNENCTKGNFSSDYKEKAHEIFKRTRVKPVERYVYLRDICEQ